MGIAERRTREKEELRTKIMEAATGLFVQEGFANVSMRKIADKIEYAPSTIYLYFKDKDELMAMIVVDTFQQLSSRLTEMESGGLPSLEALFEGIRIYVRFGLEHPNQYYLAFCTLPDMQMGNGYCAEIQGAAMAALDHLGQALGRCMHEGLIAPQDPMVLTQTVWMLIHGVTSALVFKEHDPDFPWADTAQLVEKSLEILRQGILRPAPSKN
jgi:AcrR family transcriptional regulator